MEEFEDTSILFEIVGLIVTASFQQCRLIVRKLHKSLPKMYQPPIIRPMMNLEWEEYITKMRRKIGGIFWSIKPLVVVVFKNGELFGSEQILYNYVDKKHNMTILRNFQDAGIKHLLQVLQKHVESGRKFIYLTISVDTHIIGTMLFMLYADLLPRTCKRFIKKCKQKTKGFRNTPVHRIVYGSWIQCGGFELKHHRMPCENYIIPHDRRGVLSMCHAGKHKKNSIQFSISLAPTAWMDTFYVAFGQLLQGAEVLREIEKIPTIYQSPTKSIQIVACGEFNIYESYNTQDLKDLEAFLSKDLEKRDNTKLYNVVDVDSYPDIRRYVKGLYSHHLDTKIRYKMSRKGPSRKWAAGKRERGVKPKNCKRTTKNKDVVKDKEKKNK